VYNKLIVKEDLVHLVG